MTGDVLEEWYRLSERIAKVPQYDFGKFEPVTRQISIQEKRQKGSSPFREGKSG